MKTRRDWMEEADTMVYELKNVGSEVTFETVLEEVEAVGESREYAEELWYYCERILDGAAID